MHLSIVSTTVRRADNPQEIDMVGCSWGRDLTDTCIMSLRKLTIQILIFDQSIRLLEQGFDRQFLPWEGNLTR